MGWISCRAGLWLPAAVLLGLALRSYHFLRGPSVWHDEAALIVNVLRLSFAEMLGPLIHGEAAPPLFLIAEGCSVLVFGDGVYALRLLPFLASCGALVIFALLCRRLLGPLSGALALGLFAVSDRLLWHACEAKPYAVDVLIPVVAAWWFVRTTTWPLALRCLPAAAFAPLAIWISFPACFVFGGLLVGLLPAFARAYSRGRAAFALLGVSVVASFAGLAFGPIAAQRCDAMDQCWTAHFPDYSRPDAIPLWCAIQTLEVGRYCLLPVGQVFVAFGAVGAITLGRKEGGRELIPVLLAPLGLALVASLLHKYPYGGMRVEVFAAPAICLLAATGVRRVVTLVAPRSRILAVFCIFLVLPPFVLAAFRVVEPWPRAACDEAAAFVIANRLPGTPVVVNHWEYEYYLRHETHWRSWTGQLEPAELAAGCVWVICTGDLAAMECPFALPPGWRIVRRIPFDQTVVLEVRVIDDDSHQRPAFQTASASP